MKTSTRTTVAKNLQHSLELSGMTQSDLADALGVSPASVSFWLKGTHVPRADMLDEICKVLHIPKGDLLLDADAELSEKATSKAIPIYRSMYADNNFFSDSNIERYLPVESTVPADFGISVSSPAMNGAGIDVGDVVFFSKDFEFVEGNIYAVWILNRESIALKKVYIRDNKYILVSENDDFPPIVVGNLEAVIVGELVGLFKHWHKHVPK